jgi:hypothetical protein
MSRPLLNEYAGLGFAAGSRRPPDVWRLSRAIQWLAALPVLLRRTGTRRRCLGATRLDSCRNTWQIGQAYFKESLVIPSINKALRMIPAAGRSIRRRRVLVRSKVRASESETQSFYAAQAESFDYISDYLASLPTE